MQARCRDGRAAIFAPQDLTILRSETLFSRIAIVSKDQDLAPAELGIDFKARDFNKYLNDISSPNSVSILSTDVSGNTL